MNQPWRAPGLAPALLVGCALLACGPSPEPATDAAPIEAESEAIEREPPAAPAPSVDPRARVIPVEELPEPGVELRSAAGRASLDVTHYDLAIDLRGLADSILVGHATLQITPSLDAEELALDFVGLRVDSVRIDGARAAFLQEPDLLRVVPHEPFDEALELEVFYHGTPRDGLFIGPDPAGDLTAFADNWPNRARWWFPANDHPPDKATVEFRVRAPAGYAVVANGRLLGSEGGEWRWRTDVEIPAYTIVIGVAKFERDEIGTGACGAAPEGAADGCASVTTWALAGGGEYAVERFSRAPDMIDFYTEMFGPYPYEKLAHVQSSTRFGGMENSSAIFYAMGGWAEQRMGESVIAHETVHQWFGDSVTPEAWSHLWVSEGFATYFAAVYFGERDGPDAFREAMERGREAILGSDASNRPVVDERGDLYGLLNTNSYPKGAWILHMLRSQVGDEAFFEAIRAYYAEHEEAAAGTEDVRRAMEAASGQDLGWFFAQWAYSPGFPRLDVSARSVEDATILTIEQVQPEDWTTFRLPLVIDVARAGGRVERHEILMEGRQEIFRLDGTVAREDVTIDPDGLLLLEVDPAD